MDSIVEREAEPRTGCNTERRAEALHRSGAERQAIPLTLSDDERQPCEVWTRVMGYHRPVASFNIGKKGEHAERRFFREERAQREP